MQVLIVTCKGTAMVLAIEQAETRIHNTITISLAIAVRTSKLEKPDKKRNVR
jgi:hypothetical protein